MLGLSQVQIECRHHPITRTFGHAVIDRMVSTFDLNLTEPEHALGLRFDIVLRGRDATPMER